MWGIFIPDTEDGKTKDEKIEGVESADDTSIPDDVDSARTENQWLEEGSADECADDVGAEDGQVETKTMDDSSNVGTENEQMEAESTEEDREATDCDDDASQSRMARHSSSSQTILLIDIDSCSSEERTEKNLGKCEQQQFEESHSSTNEANVRNQIMQESATYASVIRESAMLEDVDSGNTAQKRPSSRA
ncbi:hypothetical protein K469DRAFT_807264 [Zopfia rhizophila CBS 207.26]|uniref:Uncharacterized protein n=1 Tax=Zopfia rhizophila CBS 207.26 TaxID=1314779 RepID=A0A6A6DF26_9PEZI|nr:hypothetical protein K469DRAFT_807264 [Zopfia rhizophila CBS 207.26]